MKRVERSPAEAEARAAQALPDLALAKALNVQRIRLGNIQKDAHAIGKLDLKFVSEKGVFPVQLKDNGKVILVAMADPSDLDTLDEISRRSRVSRLLSPSSNRKAKTACGQVSRSGP